MKKSLLFLSIVSFLLVSSCQVDPCGRSKKQFLNNFNTFMDKVEKENLSIKDDLWKKYDTQFEKYIEECYEVHADNMTKKEDREFWANTIGYYDNRYGKGLGAVLADKANTISNAINDNADKFSDELELIINDIKINEGELKENLDELGEDLEKLGKKWGEKLEQLLESEEEK